MSRALACLTSALAFVSALAVLAVSAAACEGGGGGGKELTTLATKLSGESKEGEELTVLEGSKVKDKATLSGKNASKATGKVAYKVYSDKECKTLVITAGEVTVSGESVPTSSEEELEGGKTYYWQAHYGGDTNNAESTSPCTEVLNVKAKTSLATKLSGESKEGEELTVLEGSKVKDKATLSGTNSSTAGGKALYKVYSDKECKTLVTEAGEVTVSSGSVPASSEEELEGGKTYYWQVTYKGDALHQESKSGCTEILNVKAKTSVKTSLSGGNQTSSEVTVLEGTALTDGATLTGTNVSSATGTATYEVYSDKECKTLVAEIGPVTVSAGSVPESGSETFSPGTYYWRITYSGDALHQSSSDACGQEIAKVAKAPRIEQVDFAANDEVLIDHTKGGDPAKITKAEEAPQSSIAITDFEGEPGESNSVEWRAPKAASVIKDWPITYPETATVHIAHTRLAIGAAVQNFLENKLEGNVVLVGSTTIGGTAIEFEQKITEKEAHDQMSGAEAHPEYLEFPNDVAAKSALPKEVAYYKMKINWKWKLKEKGAAAVEQGTGESIHNLYTTFALSLAANKMYFSLLAQATENVHEVASKPKAPEVVEGTWKGFSTGLGPAGFHVWIYNPVNGEITQNLASMWYYEEMPKEEYKVVRAKEGKAFAKGLNLTSQLLENLDGECGAWVNAMITTLAIEGVSSEGVEVAPKVEKGGPCTEAEECRLLVKNWTLPQEGFGFPNKEAEVTKIEGVAGQGVATPASIFEIHLIVQVEHELYDPSYGVGPVEGALGTLGEGALGGGIEAKELQKKFQEKAIAGFCKKVGAEAKCQRISGELELRFAKA